MKKFTKNIGMLLLVVWIIAYGLIAIIPALGGLGFVLQQPSPSPLESSS